MATKKKSKRYRVEARIENISLAKTGSSISLEVYGRSAKLGTLQIGRGSIFWWGAKKQTRKRLRWDRVAEQLNRLAYPKEFP